MDSTDNTLPFIISNNERPQAARKLTPMETTGFFWGTLDDRIKAQTSDAEIEGLASQAAYDAEYCDGLIIDRPAFVRLARNVRDTLRAK